MRIKPRQDPPVPPVTKSFESHANDEEERRRLPPRWPHKSGEKPASVSKKTERKRRPDQDDGVKSVPTVIYAKDGKGGVVLKTIPEDAGEGQSLDCKA